MTDKVFQFANILWSLYQVQLPMPSTAANMEDANNVFTAVGLKSS